MGYTRALQLTAAAALAGTLIFSSAPMASADQTRDAQWALKTFDAEAIWKISKGKGVTVAVIDSGVNANHVDLTGNVTARKDFAPGESTMSDSDAYHGTEMASIIAGHGHGPDNSEGVMGLAPEAKILDVRDLGNGNDGYASSIRYAVDHGASVINISQEVDQPADQAAESQAISYALKKNVLVVAGTGNTGTSAGYPASYPGVIGVGGVNNNMEIWERSNFGPHVLLTAPATNVVAAGGSTNTAYRMGDGTSDSTAYVSAAAALLRSKFPDLTAGQIVNRLVKTAGLPSSAKGISLPDEHYGYGYIQPLAALTKNIPAGSKYGPLTVPPSIKQGSDSTASPDTSADRTASSAQDNPLKRAVFFVILGVIALLIIGLIVFLIVKIARRNKGGGNGPGGPGTPGGYSPGQPPYGRQPHQQQPQGNPYMPPQQGQPLYPNQPQQQPPSSWGNN